ncbi:hypothetical protein D3C73_1586050 [compost metagenome]
MADAPKTMSPDDNILSTSPISEIHFIAFLKPTLGTFGMSLCSSPTIDNKDGMYSGITPTFFMILLFVTRSPTTRFSTERESET